MTLWLTLSGLAAAQTWPDDSEWVQLTQQGTLMTDPADDHGPTADDSADLVSTAAEAVVAWAVDEVDLYVRMQVARSPLNGPTSWFGPTQWVWLLDLDGDDSNAEVGLMVDANPVPTVKFYEAEGGLDDLALNFVQTAGTDTDGAVRTVGAGSQHFVDLRISRLDAAALGWTDTASVRVAAAVASPSYTLGWTDVATCDDRFSLCDTLADVLSDPFEVDLDLDGLPGPVEDALGTDPADADTDDDGLIDSVDHDGGLVDDIDGDGLIAPLDPDSDGDGLLDGLEAGVDVAHPDTDPTVFAFTPDADPSTTTSPWLADTDGGGLDDGWEDWSGDGEQGFWETDPNDPSDDLDTDGDTIPDIFDGLDPYGDVDDVDSDGDGHSDELEFLYDTDGDNVPDFLDDDSDGDGIPDADESADDVDGDGLPGFRDTDSDGDGIPDGVEGTDDADGDGIPNLEDLDSDGDGALDADEGTGDADGDGVPDFLDADSDADGDGIPDSVEGSGDTDGDGIPDFLDDDSDGDGIPDSVEGYGDTDNDGTPDFQDTNSDGNGGPDADEGTDDDDCDGIPNFQDPDHEDSFCDTGLTTPSIDPGTDTPFVGTDDTDPFSAPGQFTGGACSTVGSSSMGPGLLLLALAALRRRRKLAAVALALPSVASAQSVNAQRLAASVDGGHLVKVEDGDTVENGDASLGLVLSHADDPFVYRTDDGEEFDVLGAATTSELLGSYTLGSLTVGAAVPVHLYTDGLDSDAPTHLGDLRLVAKGRVADVALGSFHLRPGAVIDLSLPTGTQDAWIGAGAAVATGRALTSLFTDGWMAAVNLGVRSGTGNQLGELSVSPALVWGVGTAVDVVDGTSLGLEVEGEGWTGNPDLMGANPVEWLGNVRQRVGQVQLRAGAGTGLSRGVGAPDLRLVAGIMWHPAAKEAPVVEPVSSVEPPPPVGGTAVVRAQDLSGRPIPGASVRIAAVKGDEQASGMTRDGVYEATVPAGRYEVTVSATGFLPAKRTVTVGDDHTVDLLLMLRPSEAVVVDTDARRIFLKEKIFFELDKAELKVASLQVLDPLVEVLLTQPELRVRIEGHTDAQGSESHNLELSQDRADTVRTYLISQGVPADRLEAKGYGESRLLQSGDSDDVHATNRRVEFHLLEE
jgi:uncharacterized protein (TIGR03382 family)